MTSPVLRRGVHVPRGTDRHHAEKLMIWGLIPLSIKVSTKDTGGELMIFQHTDMGKGGPPRHVHHAQDEWFCVVKGEFRAEVGGEEYRLGPGDWLFAPRGVPHAWAHVGEGPGTLITGVSPAGTFETFILNTTKDATLPAPEEVARQFTAHGMTVLGPPLRVD